MGRTVHTTLDSGAVGAAPSLSTILDLADAAAAGRWLATAHVADLDPQMGRLGMPTDPEPRAEYLAPFLHAR